MRGKVVYFLFLLCFIQDHPRLCGEKFVRVPMVSIKKGSPPPMRGKAYSIDVQLVFRRITPAYAGKSSKRQ